jgi:SulP family sulfate permease
LVIGFSQLKHLFGTHVASSEYPIVLMGESIAKIAQANWITFAVGISSCLLLLFFCKSLAGILKRMGLNAKLSDTLAKIGPLVAVVIAALLVWTGGLSDKHAVAIVGHVPSGLPQFTLPASDVKTIIALLPLALIIAFVGYLESISVATALADRQQKKIDSNRELLALGMADLGAAFTGGYPVTGGFSRSIVNYSAGARTPIGSVITALLIALSVTLFTPLFYYIPNSVLAAIILVAVAQLVDIRTPFLLWRFSRNDAIAFLITFVAVLLIGIEKGILVGMGATIFALLWRTSHPHIAEVGRVGETEHFRNIQRHEVQTTAGVLALRIDESLHFANVRWLEAYVLKRVERSSDIHTVLLIASGINDIDSSGIEFLESLDHQLAEKEVKLIMSEVKGPVTDRLKLAGFDVDFLERRIFLSTDKAMQSLVSECNQNTKDAGDFGHFGPQFATTESIPQSK